MHVNLMEMLEEIMAETPNVANVNVAGFVSSNSERGPEYKLGVLEKSSMTATLIFSVVSVADYDHGGRCCPQSKADGERLIE